MPTAYKNKCSNLSQFETPCSFATPDCPAGNQAGQLALFLYETLARSLKQKHYADRYQRKN